ncbi:hypothetical protein L1887_00815 [Cichorium endivia]|nr:hypothetical protein L1887_00815 [Cichorium endivia]
MAPGFSHISSQFLPIDKSPWPSDSHTSQVLPRDKPTVNKRCKPGRQPSSEDERENEDVRVHYARGGDSEDEAESQSEIEENFLKRIKENKNSKDQFKKERDDLVTQRSSPNSGFDFGEESSVMTDGWMSGASMVSKKSEIGIEVVGRHGRWNRNV